MIPAVAWIDFVNLWAGFTGNFYLNTPYFYGNIKWVIYIAVVVVVFINFHCADLLVKTKRSIIDHVMKNMARVEDRYQITAETQKRFRCQLERYLQITDLAEFCFGPLGRINIEFSIFFTQFGIIILQIFTISSHLQNAFTTCKLVNISDRNSTLCSPDPGPDYHVYNCSGPDQGVVKYMLCPFLIFCFMSLLRTPRQVFICSLMSILCLSSAVIFITINLIKNDVSDWKYEVETSHEFFLYVTFTVPWIQLVTQTIPLESSMVGTRKYFSNFLIVISFIALGGCTCFATVIFNHNFDIPKVACSIVRMQRCNFLNVLQIVGVSCLFPLQNFPLVDAFERRLLTAKICQESEESTPINHMPDVPFLDTKRTPNKLIGLLRSCSEDVFRDTDIGDVLIITTKWSRRYLLRVCLIATQVAFAMVMALSQTALMVLVSFGVFASRLAAFIFPCALHLNFSWSSLHVLVKLKDAIIILLSIVEVLWSLYKITDFHNEIFKPAIS